MAQSTVFFGPFIGEFGWELLFWQGWVRKVCRTTFREYRKIAASYPGRRPFYPYVDEFWPLPEQFIEQHISARNYMADGWRNGFPGSNQRVRRYRFGMIPQWQSEEHPISGGDVEPLANALLASYSSRLPTNTTYFVPWRHNQFEPNQLEFGAWALREPRCSADFAVRRIPFECQELGGLEPTSAGRERYCQLFPGVERLIALFPRHRALRRADKNWSRDNYAALIQRLQAALPEYPIGIFGAPDGAYFSDGVPAGCVDFIHVPEDHRMDIQIAALQTATVAVGSMSGAVLVALAAGCPSVTWGYWDERDRYHQENYLRTRFIFHPVMDASVDEIACLVEGMVAGMIPEVPQEHWRTERFLRRRSGGLRRTQWCRPAPSHAPTVIGDAG